MLQKYAIMILRPERSAAFSRDSQYALQLSTVPAWTLGGIFPRVFNVFSIAVDLVPEAKLSDRLLVLQPCLLRSAIFSYRVTWKLCMHNTHGDKTELNYAGIMLDALKGQLCSKLCWHNIRNPNAGNKATFTLLWCRYSCTALEPVIRQITPARIHISTASHMRNSNQSCKACSTVECTN